MKKILMVSALLGSAGWLAAQTAPTSAAVVSSNASVPAFLAQVPATLQQKEQAFFNSRSQFVAHNFVAAEAALLAGNTTTVNTPQWHCESGAALMRMAFSFHAEADATTASTIAQHALAHLQQADQSYAANTDPAELANENELRGFLYENLMGDRDSAKLCYQKAVTLSPNTGHAAELLAALLRAEAEVESKRHYISGQ